MRERFRSGEEEKCGEVGYVAEGRGEWGLERFVWGSGEISGRRKKLPVMVTGPRGGWCPGRKIWRFGW